MCGCHSGRIKTHLLLHLRLETVNFFGEAFRQAPFTQDTCQYSRYSASHTREPAYAKKTTKQFKKINNKKMKNNKGTELPVFFSTTLYGLLFYFFVPIHIAFIKLCVYVGNTCINIFFYVQICLSFLIQYTYEATSLASSTCHFFVAPF